MADDPVADLLRKMPVSNDQRAKLWQTYYDSPDADTLAATLQPVGVPTHVKAAMWSLRNKQTQDAPHPEASIGPEDENRPVTLGDLIDDPKAALSRMVTLTKNTLKDPKVMLPLAAGVAYGAYKGSGMGTGRVPVEEAPAGAPVAPKVGLKQALKENVHPDDIAGMMPKPIRSAYNVVTGVGRAVRQAGRSVEPVPAEVPTASVPTAVEPPTQTAPAPAAPPTEPVVTPKPKAARVAKAKAETTPDEGMPSFDDLQLTPAEIKAAVKWQDQGVDPRMILHRILQSRQLTARTRTETPDQAAEAVRYRNEHGRWQSEK